MAIGTPTVRARVNNAKAGITSVWDFNPEATINVDEYAVAFIAMDNAGGPGGLDGFAALVHFHDSLGNPWVKIGEYCDEAAAGGGETVAAFHCKVRTQITTGTTMRVSVQPNRTVTAAAAIIFAGSTTAGKRLMHDKTILGGANGAVDPPSLTLTPALPGGNKEYLFVRGAAHQGVRTATFTKTAAWQGNWGLNSETSGTTGGSAGTNMAAYLEWDIKTGTASDASDPATGTDVAHAHLMFGLYEIDDQPDAPYYIGSGFRSTGLTGVDVTPTLPLGVAENDIIVIQVETNQGEEPAAPPTGYAEVADSPQAQATNTSSLTLYWKRAGAGESAPAGFQTTGVGGSSHTIATCHVFRGCATTGNPWDVTSGGTEGTSDTSLSATGDTTTVANTLVAVFVATSIDGDSSWWTDSTVANADLVEPRNAYSYSSTIGGGGSIHLAVGEKPAAAAFGPTTATLISAASKEFISVAFKPQVAGGAQEVNVALISQSGQIFAVTTTATLDVNVALISQTPVIFSPDSNFPATVPVPLIQQAPLVFAVTLTATLDVPVPLIDQSGQIFGTTIDTSTQVVLPLISNPGQPFAVSLSLGGINVPVDLISQAGQVFAVTLEMTADELIGIISQPGAAFALTVEPGNLNLPVSLIQQLGQAFAVTTEQAGGVTPDLIQQIGAPFNITIQVGAITVEIPLIQQIGTMSPATAGETVVQTDFLWILERMIGKVCQNPLHRHYPREPIASEDPEVLDTTYYNPVRP